MATDIQSPPFVEENIALSIPHSREAEEALCGSVLINPEVYYEVAHKIRADDFYIHRLKWVWEAFGRLHEKRAEFDLITVSEELGAHGQLAEIGGSAFLTSLISLVPTSLNAEYYADIIFEHAIRRRAIKNANELAQVAYDETKSCDDVINIAMQNSISLATQSSSDKRLFTSRQSAEEEWARMERVAKYGEPDGIKTGYPDIDHIINSMAPGDLNIIAGRTGMGKTSLMQSIVHNNLKQYGKKILVAQVTDLDRSGWVQRLISMESRIPLEIIQSANFSDLETPRYVSAFEIISSYPFMIDDTPSMTVEKLLSVARRAHANLNGIDLLVVDYIQKMGVPREIQKRTNRVGEVDHITSGLKFIARELNVPVLAAAQLSRSVEQRNDKRPTLADLRESGALEQDSQLVMFIYRDESEKTKKPNIAEIIVAKNTNGRVGSAELLWVGNLTRFESVARY